VHVVGSNYIAMLTINNTK